MQNGRPEKTLNNVQSFTQDDLAEKLNLEIEENKIRKGFTFSELMHCAELRKAELSKVARENQQSTQFGNTDCQTFVTPIGRVNDKLAQELDLGSGEQYRKAEYIYKNADEEMIKALDENKLSINKAYNTVKQQMLEATKISSDLAVKNKELNEKINKKTYQKTIDKYSEKVYNNKRSIMPNTQTTRLLTCVSITFYIIFIYKWILS